MSAAIQISNNAVASSMPVDSLACDFSVSGSCSSQSQSQTQSQMEIQSTTKPHKSKKPTPMQNPSARLLRHLMSAGTSKDNNRECTDSKDGNTSDGEDSKFKCEGTNQDSSQGQSQTQTQNSGTNTPKRLYNQDVALLRQLNKESNNGIEFSPDFQEKLETASRANFQMDVEDPNCMGADTMSLASHVGKVYSGYMVLYKQGSNVLSESGGSHKPRWVSLTQGGKLVVCKRAENGQYTGKPRIIDLVNYDRCDFVGESRTLITLYSMDRTSNVKSLCFVTPEEKLALEWSNLINTSINQVKLRSMLRKEVQSTRGLIVGTEGGDQEEETLEPVSMTTTREGSEEEREAASPVQMT